MINSGLHNHSSRATIISPARDGCEDLESLSDSVRFLALTAHIQRAEPM